MWDYEPGIKTIQEFAFKSMYNSFDYYREIEKYMHWVVS